MANLSIFPAGAKVNEARLALDGSKDQLGRESVVERANRAKREKRPEVERQRAEVKRRAADLAGLRDRFLELASVKPTPANVRRRGRDFEILLRDIFALYDLDPRGAFARRGEQVDGSITLDGKFILVEAKWESALISARAVISDAAFRSVSYDCKPKNEWLEARPILDCLELSLRSSSNLKSAGTFNGKEDIGSLRGGSRVFGRETINDVIGRHVSC